MAGVACPVVSSEQSFLASSTSSGCFSSLLIGGEVVVDAEEVGVVSSTRAATRSSILGTSCPVSASNLLLLLTTNTLVVVLSFVNTPLDTVYCQEQYCEVVVASPPPVAALTLSAMQRCRAVHGSTSSLNKRNAH